MVLGGAGAIGVGLTPFFQGRTQWDLVQEDNSEENRNAYTIERDAWHTWGRPAAVAGATMVVVGTTTIVAGWWWLTHEIGFGLDEELGVKGVEGRPSESESE